MLVFHLNDASVEDTDMHFALRAKGARDAALKAWAASCYSPVAEVEANGADDMENLEIAFERTNHIMCDWRENEGVKALATRCRSTSVGDIVKIGHALYLCSPIGWTKLENANV